MSRRRRKRRGLMAAPGTIEVHPDSMLPNVRLMAYGPDELHEQEAPSLESLPGALGKYPVTWVDIDGLGDKETILQIGRAFGLHQLALEDVVNFHQRPKAESYGDYQYIVTRMPIYEDGRIATEQVNLFLGRNFVVTFQEGLPGDTMGPVRHRLHNAQYRIRREGADYLAYSILDAVVDSYFPVLESYGERLECLEDEVLGQPDRHTIMQLQLIKRDLLTLRRIFWPLREAVGALLKDPTTLIKDETRLFMRDVYDHTVQLLDLLETYREISAGLVDLYLSSVSNRMNEVMKALTIIATIFIPLSFIAGLYGMNFDPDTSPWNMPELRWYYGYPFAIALMSVVAAGLVTWIWRKGWFSGQEPPHHSQVEELMKVHHQHHPLPVNGKANGA